MLSFCVLTFLLVHGLEATPTRPRPHDERIIGGVDVADNEFPYMVSLNFVQDGTHTCGASVLTENWVLTAAHCCEDSDKYPMYVYAGSMVLSEGGERYEIAALAIHGDYVADQNGYQDDICAIQLSTPLKLGDTIQKVTLAGPDFNVNEGEDVYISGWGYTSPDGTEQHIPDRMQLLDDYKAITNQQCGKTYDGFVCAQAVEGQGPCEGDSGGPLMLNAVQIGVASTVVPPCATKWRDVYTRVSYYGDFLRQAMGDEVDDIQFA